MKKVYQAVMIAALFVSSFGLIAAPQYNVSAKSCGVGYVLKNGNCVAIKATDSRAARIAACILKGGGKGTAAQQAARLAQCLKIK